MFHDIMEQLLLVERGEWHVLVVNVVDVVVELGNEECNVLAICGKHCKSNVNCKINDCNPAHNT